MVGIKRGCDLYMTPVTEGCHKREEHRGRVSHTLGVKDIESSNGHTG